jgi:hypothetical protein
MDCRHGRLTRRSTDSLLRQDRRIEGAVCQLAYARRRKDVLESPKNRRSVQWLLTGYTLRGASWESEMVEQNS